MDANKQIEQMALTWAERARTIQVVNQEGYDCACAMLKDLSTVEARIVDHHAPIKEAAHRAHKAACEAEKKLLVPVQEAKTVLKRAIGAWEYEQEQTRLTAQRDAEAVQRKAEEDARLALAVEAEKAGAPAETTEEILSTPIITAPVIVAPTFQRASGVIASQRWRAEIIDIKALCRAIADGKVSETCIVPNMTVLNSLARSLKQTMNIPGVRSVPETTVAVRKAV